MKSFALDNSAIDLSSLRDKVARSGAKPSRIAVEAGVSRALIDALMEQADEPGLELPHELINRLRAWADEIEAGSSTFDTVDPEWVETPTAKEIAAALTFAAQTPTLAVIYGGAGVGKTTTLCQFRRSTPNVWLVTASQFSVTPTAILQKVSEAVDYWGGPSRTDTLAKEVMNRMRDAMEYNKSKGLLIIDEAQHLNARALDGLRSLHDETGIGLAFVGNETVFARMKGGGMRAAAFAQIYSRVGRRLHITQPKEEDVDVILESWGISGRKERDYAQRIASLPGGLRQLVQLIRQAKVAAQHSGLPVDVRLLKASGKSLGIGE
jgi:DNA transposition AAA+ family ATPase